MPSQRLEATLGVIQTAISAPAREGAALMVGVRAALDALRRSIANRPPRSRSGDDEDALFIWPARPAPVVHAPELDRLPPAGRSQSFHSRATRRFAIIGV